MMTSVGRAVCRSQLFKLVFASRGRRIVTSPYPAVASPNCNYVSEVYRGIERYCQRTALIDGPSGQKFTYTELREAVSSVASALTKRGLRKGHILTVFTHNRPEFVFAGHGAIAAGITVCPVNSSYTEPELKTVLKDSGSKFIVTEKQRLNVVRSAYEGLYSSPSIYLLDATRSECHELGCEPFEDLLIDDGRTMGKDCVDVNPDTDLAFLPYSSGTSGLPKGVQLSHNNVAVNLRQGEVIFEDRVAEETVMGVLPFYHIYGLNVILGHSLHTGGTVVTMSAFQPELFLKLTDQHKVTILYLAPPLILFLLQHPLVKETDLSSVRRIMSGGAPLGGNVIEEMTAAFKDRLPNVDVMQGYGLTEMSSICNACPPPYRRPQGVSTSASVGVSVPSQECKIIDTATKEKLGVGESGEIFIRGPHTMLGYWNRPEATAESLDADGWYATGDIGHVDEHGFFYISDRVKELIKFKGFQVAPAELEAVLLSHPDITDCAVIGRVDPAAGELPTAFIVRRSDELDEAAVHRFFAERLSSHKQLRGGIFFVDAVPRSPAGKLLRRHLRDQLNP